MLRNCNRTSSFGLQGLFTWAQIKNIAYVILPFFGLLETLFYITTKICANSMLYRLFSRIIDKIPFNEIAFFNAIYFWKKYFKDLLKLFIIELKENLYYKYLKATILYPGLCSIFLVIMVIMLIFFCDNSTVYAYDLPEKWTRENLEHDFTRYYASNPQRCEEAYNSYLRGKDFLNQKYPNDVVESYLYKKELIYQKHLDDIVKSYNKELIKQKYLKNSLDYIMTLERLYGDPKSVLTCIYNSHPQIPKCNGFYEALLENQPQRFDLSPGDMVTELTSKINQELIKDALLKDNYILPPGD